MGRMEKQMETTIQPYITPLDFLLLPYQDRRGGGRPHPLSAIAVAV